MHNSLGTFSRRSSTLPQAALSILMLACLLAGAGFAVYSMSWPFVVIFAASILGLAAYTWFSFEQSRRFAASKDQRRIDWEAALPEVQRQNINVEVFELSRILEVETEQIGDLQSAYIVAEDLALRQIQQEENVPLMRHVSIGKVPFDAVMVKNDVIACCEVSFLVAPDLRQDKVDAMMRKIVLVKHAIEKMKIGMKVRLMMILITQMPREDEESLRASLGTKRFTDTPVDIDIRLLDFEALQRIFVTD
ncbi:MAG: hypothetical protein ACT4O9_09040 [Blastocatellia bacterium]